VLPEQRAQLAQRFPQGAIVKCHAFYDEPFWVQDGFSGEVISDRTVRIAGAGTPPDGKPGVMVGFVTGDAARALVQQPPDERRRVVLEDYAAFFGPKALAPWKYIDLAWAAEVWTRGGQTGSAPPGVLLRYGTTIREPVGRIHWSGSETAVEYTGSVEGAIRSGLDTAGQVLNRL
jgi:monoamine oxidase